MREAALLAAHLLVGVEEAGEVAEDAFALQPPEQPLAGDPLRLGFVAQALADLPQTRPLFGAPRLGRAPCAGATRG